MLSKIRLERGKKFEISLATYKVAVMVTKFMDGLAHHLSLGSEDAGIKHWDDFLIETEVNCLEHIQVKRQETPFSKKKVIRGKTRKKADQTLVDDELSEFDISLKSLLDWLKTTDVKKSIIKRKFIFEISNLDVLVKKELPIRKFKELAKVVKPATTVAQLQALASNDQSVKLIYDYLTSWCDITSWNDMLILFQVIYFVQNGDYDDLDERTFQLLSSYFTKTSDVILRIKNLVDEDSTFPNKLTPRAVFCVVSEYLLPGRKKWTQFRKVANEWEISGIHDDDQLENSRKVVQQVWTDKHSSELKLDVPPNSGGILGDAILRMALHFNSSSGFHTTECGAWREIAKVKVGATLGDERDLDSFTLYNYSSFCTSDFRPLDCRDKMEEETNELHDEMDQVCWDLIVDKIELKIDNMVSGNIRSLIEKRWIFWKDHLQNNKTDRNDFLHNSMLPIAEDIDVVGKLRVGRKTVHIIADAVYLLLIVSICLNEADDNWDKLKEPKVNIYALRFWSGPSGDLRNVRRIADYGINDLMGKETAEVLILSGTETPISAIRNNSLSGRNNSLDLTLPNRPKVIITAIPYIDYLVRNNEFKELKDYVNGQILDQANNLNNKISSLIK